MKKITMGNPPPTIRLIFLLFIV